MVDVDLVPRTRGGALGQGASRSRQAVQTARPYPASDAIQVHVSSFGAAQCEESEASDADGGLQRERTQKQENQITGNQLRLITSEMVNFLEPNANASGSNGCTHSVGRGSSTHPYTSTIICTSIIGFGSVTIHADKQLDVSIAHNVCDTSA